MLHHLYDSKPLKTSMGGVRAWHPQNSLSACWMEKTLSKGVCGKKGDMKEWKRTSRRNCVPSPSLEEKPNLTRWGRGDIQANVIYTPDTLILLVAVLSLSFCPTITHTVDLFKFTFCIKKRELFNVAEIASSPLISVLLFSYRNRTPDILLDTRMPRVITTYPRLSCSYVWPYDYFLVNGRWAEVMSATFWRVNICFPPLFFCSHKLDTWAILESEFENKLKRGWASEATIPVLDHVTRIITWKMKQTSNLFKPVIRGSLSTGKLISIYSYFLVSPVWFFFFLSSFCLELKLLLLGVLSSQKEQSQVKSMIVLRLPIFQLSSITHILWKKPQCSEWSDQFQKCICPKYINGTIRFGYKEANKF